MVGAAILGLLLIFYTRRFGGGAGTIFKKDDPRLLAAKAQARATLPTFWAALEAGDPADDGFAIKFNLNHGAGEGDNESIWAGEIVRRDGRIFGQLLNKPVNAAYNMGQEVEIAPEAIDDWGFWRNGVAQGHYVTRLMIEGAPAGTARRQRMNMGWG